MPAVFDKAGIRFQYPENWVLDEGSAPGGAAVSVESPGGAFWSVMEAPRSSEPQEVARAALGAMQEEYEVEVDGIEEQVAGHDLVGYDLSFFFLDLTSTAQIRAVRTAMGTYLIHCQAEDREFEQIEPVLRAITVSLLREERGGD